MSPDTKFHFESTDKFLHNLDTVLAGRTFHLAMDDGEDFELRFVTGNIVEWRRPGEALRYEEYGCLRADDKVYFVSSLLGGTESPVCVTMVLDEEQSLVTMAVSRIGFYPKRPRLAVVDITFGAIRVQDHLALRHRFYQHPDLLHREVLPDPSPDRPPHTGGNRGGGRRDPGRAKARADALRGADARDPDKGRALSSLLR